MNAGLKSWTWLFMLVAGLSIYCFLSGNYMFVTPICLMWLSIYLLYQDRARKKELNPTPLKDMIVRKTAPHFYQPYLRSDVLAYTDLHHIDYEVIELYKEEQRKALLWHIIEEVKNNQKATKIMSYEIDRTSLEWDDKITKWETLIDKTGLIYHNVQYKTDQHDINYVALCAYEIKE